MKKQLFILGLVAMGTGVFTLPSCSDASSDNRQEAKEKMDDAKKDLKDANNATADALKAERDQLAADMRRQGEAIDAEIESIDRKLEKASAQEKARWQVRRKNLADDRDRLNANLKELGSDMSRGWNEFKSDVNKTLEKINEDLKSDQ